MLSKRSAQLGMFEADHLYLSHVGEDTFYGFLARHRGQLFRDEDFAEFYSPDQGRPSVPPSLLATALLLQTHDRVSDEEAKARADYDLRWKVALGVEVDARPFAKSTLQLFRAQLVLNEKMQAGGMGVISTAPQLGRVCLAGAALDVLAQEPPQDNPLLQLPQVIVVPHIGGYTMESLNQVGWTCARNIAAVLKGEKPPYPVNL